jgi:1-acyl-sn-glycerol-3-phosphate acyltransferase
MSLPLTNTAIASSSADTPAVGVRAVVRLTALALWSTFTVGMWLAGQVLFFWSPAWRRTVRRQLFQRWARVVLRLLGVRTVVQGTVPARPFLLVSNHLGYLDIVAYAANLPTRFVAKQEVRGWPVVGFLAWAMDTIFIDRAARRDTKRVLDQVAAAIDAGDGVTIFAEATSTAGQTVLPFRPALLEWGATTGSPVHYASVSYRTPSGTIPAHLSVCWWGDMTFGRHLVRLAQLPRIDATLRLGAEPIVDPDRKQLAARLHQAVSAQFIPVVME